MLLPTYPVRGVVRDYIDSCIIRRNLKLWVLGGVLVVLIRY